MLMSIPFALFGIAYGEVYKYEDADGNVVFTDEPPADVETEVVDLPAYGPPSTPTPIGRVRRPPAENPDIDEAERRRIENLAQEQIAEHERRCVEARVALEVLHQGMPVYWVRDGEYRAAWHGDTYEGSRVYLSERQRTEAIDGQVRKLVQNCADPFSEEQQAQASDDWLNEEKCMEAREDLELNLRQQTRATEDFLERKREKVRRYCGGDK